MLEPRCAILKWISTKFPLTMTETHWCVSLITARDLWSVSTEVYWHPCKLHIRSIIIEYHLHGWLVSHDKALSPLSTVHIKAHCWHVKRHKRRKSLWRSFFVFGFLSLYETLTTALGGHRCIDPAWTSAHCSKASASSLLQFRVDAFDRAVDAPRSCLRRLCQLPQENSRVYYYFLFFSRRVASSTHSFGPRTQDAKKKIYYFCTRWKSREKKSAVQLVSLFSRRVQ